MEDTYDSWRSLGHLVYYRTKQILITNHRRPMKPRQHSVKELQECYQSPYTKHKGRPMLQNILEQIKFLQNCVNQMDTEHIQDATMVLKQKGSKSASRQKHASLGHYANSKDLRKVQKEANSCNKYQNIQTIRRSPKIQQHHSATLKPPASNFEMKSFEFFENSSKRDSQCDPQFPTSYMSLQVENLKLEKQNLNLEKQLLEQELLMERREKQLLKNRLKRMKTHLINKPATQSKNHEESPRPNVEVREFKISPIKIRIPQFLQDEQPTQQHKSKKNQSRNKLKTTKTYESIASDKNLDHIQTDQLLISHSSDQERSKENLGVLENEFWSLLSQCEHQKSDKKWQIRQALGDIANKMKSMRKH